MNILQKPSFKRAYRRLHANQKKDADEAIRTIIKNPLIGEVKVGDLAGVYIYKFKMVRQLTLLAYTFDDGALTLTLLALDTHENFYRDLKR